MVLQINPVQSPPLVTWESLPKDYVLADEPVENIQQPLLAAALTEALGSYGFIQPEMLIASNFALVARVDNRVVVKAPDWLYVPQVQTVIPGTLRRSYTPYLEGDPVAVVMEFLSDEDNGELSLRSTPPYGKLYVYEQIFKVPNYVTFDPYTLRLELRRLEGNQYHLKTADAHGRFWIPEMNLFLGTWQGKRLGQTITWLRWWDREGNLLFWSSEQAETERERAEREQQRAEALAQKLEELGIDPNTLG
ncbi:Uma2 family endonuclease [Candidatus Synechococcus calcipolaris G9]|uniref:Uma2 family endonuclease n=1 Tax=Candidatus Synechococcus calcipolaris G9 TaxID=1497997 RepID=A0ABT6F3J2_9SYNE|nr:Uma2 family endonuclease [Candidatus Synechococcus calcipolaris]MDG2992439.1 Uma2 family endonuclease [Candidatus Synechococcus calcipolaris G9]